MSDTRPAAREHRFRTGHDLALMSAAASNCAECDWSAPLQSDTEPRELTSTADYAAWLRSVREVIAGTEVTTMTDTSVRTELMELDRVLADLEFAVARRLRDGMVTTGEIPAVEIPATPEDEAGRIGPTMPQEGQK